MEPVVAHFRWLGADGHQAAFVRAQILAVRTDAQWSGDGFQPDDVHVGHVPDAYKRPVKDDRSNQVVTFDDSRVPRLPGRMSTRPERDAPDCLPGRTGASTAAVSCSSHQPLPKTVGRLHEPVAAIGAGHVICADTFSAMRAFHIPDRLVHLSTAFTFVSSI